MVFVENDSFRNLRRPPTDAFRSIPRLPREALPVAASDLAAWYPFRAGTGEDLTAGDSRFGDTTDYSAVVNGATFQASGGVTDIQTGANSGAFDFDGTDDTLDLGTVADSDQSLTIMTWVKPDTVATSQRVITKQDSSTFADGRILLDISVDSEPRFLIEAGTVGRVTDSSTLNADQHVHLAGRYDFQNTEITLFRNGGRVGATGVGQAPPRTAQPWRIGEDNVAVNFDQALNGTVDGTRIYTAALSGSQINQIYLNTEP